MIVVGAVLLVVAALFTLASVFNGSAVDYKILDRGIEHVSVGGLFLTGLVTGVVAMLALQLLLGGAARKRRKSVERKREVKSARGTAETVQQENARLKDELAQTQTQTQGQTSAPYPDETGSSTRLTT